MIGIHDYRALIVVQTLIRQFVEHNAFDLYRRFMHAAKRWYSGVPGCSSRVKREER